MRNNTHYARPGQLYFGERRYMLPTLGEALGALAEKILVISDRYRLYRWVERCNLLVNEQYEEGRDTSTWIVHIRPLVFDFMDHLYPQVQRFS